MDLQSHKNFAGIIESPLSSCKSSNHENTERKPTGKETHNTKLIHGLNKPKHVGSKRF